ncbi:MAG: hypothetical protein GYB64_07725 [Chloroflexi bacterium]|nr:hypothetical protein [Chloroflexota bacterium]
MTGRMPQIGDTITTREPMLSSEGLTQIRTYIAARVGEGFDTYDEMVEGVVDYYAIKHPELIRPHIERVACQMLEAHRAAQQHWTGLTDCDRLDRAFVALEEAGIVARQNFTCCQSCGHAEIGMEADESAFGYVFYHNQDTESAYEYGSLMLAYGAFTHEDEDIERVGKQVVEMLRQHGLPVAWNGSIHTRIAVQPIDWKKRR